MLWLIFILYCIQTKYHLFYVKEVVQGPFMLLIQPTFKTICHLVMIGGNAQCPCNLYYKCSYWKNNWYQYNEFIKLSKVITITSMYNVTTINISHVDETWKGLREGIFHFVTKNSILKNISRKLLNVLNMGRKIWYSFWCHIN